MNAKQLADKFNAKTNAAVVERERRSSSELRFVCETTQGPALARRQVQHLEIEALAGRNRQRV